MSRYTNHTGRFEEGFEGRPGRYGGDEEKISTIRLESRSYGYRTRHRGPKISGMFFTHRRGGRRCIRGRNTSSITLFREGGGWWMLCPIIKEGPGTADE